MSKQEKYEEWLPQLAALIAGETDETAVLANASAALAAQFHWFWTGFYVVRRVDGASPASELPQHELRLGPFQGSVACYHIPYGRGVCGTAWQQNRTLVVPDVEAFPGHIACSSLSRSEIVVPMRDAQGTVRGVLDIDSTELATFDAVDQAYLERAVDVIARQLYAAPAPVSQ